MNGLSGIHLISQWRFLSNHVSLSLELINKSLRFVATTKAWP